MSSRPQISVVIPAYNEAAVIRQTVREVAAYLDAVGLTHEIVVVDDGSTDGTVAIVRELESRLPSLRLILASHHGKGGAVKRGALEAAGEAVLFMDADHSTRIEELQKCLPWLEDGFQVVIGSRKTPGAEVRVHQPPVREAMGRVFTWLTNQLLGTRVTDITCGFKCFTAEAAAEIFQLQRIAGWGFDAEILFIARHRGWRIKEVPVVWTDDATTKVRLLHDTLRSLSELVSIRAGAWRGRYASGRREPGGPHA